MMTWFVGDKLVSDKTFVTNNYSAKTLYKLIVFTSAKYLFYVVNPVVLSYEYVVYIRNRHKSSQKFAGFVTSKLVEL